MQRKWRIGLFALATLLAAALAALVWFFLPERDRMFHGKRESEWVTNIVYGMQLTDDQNKAQAQRWRDFGPEGLRVLERGLEPSGGHRYRKLYRSYPETPPLYRRPPASASHGQIIRHANVCAQPPLQDGDERVAGVACRGPRVGG